MAKRKKKEEGEDFEMATIEPLSEIEIEDMAKEEIQKPEPKKVSSKVQSDYEKHPKFAKFKKG